ncbi:V8-like Glu-specific endopeptidase [Dongia mobilis]|uniref:V8-like Glu-specific endopeptidase n=1 Tax=Dongia mobilis TaxID=578943 RepID=A0A4V6PXJ7_9PROT|nr:trypsin-like peptidase domain-containing protein [Dongia mobilis]TDQ83450.1 V8-like Glu-specific endopeptidase [Dongia mobilis]
MIGRFLSLLLLAGLAACATRAPVTIPPPAPPPPTLPWTAAIGQLDMGPGARPCTAVLVAPDLIVTAAHCLFQGNSPARFDQIAFRLNFGAAPDLGRFGIQAVRAYGGAIRENQVRKAADVAADWALLRIAPPVAGVAPVPVVALTPTQIIAELAGGARLFTAGYGYGAQKTLKPHGSCRIIDGAANGLGRDPGMLVTDCIIRVGDSGGPVALVYPDGRPRLVGIFSGFGVNGQTGLSFASNAGNFAAYLDRLLVSHWLGS